MLRGLQTIISLVASIIYKYPLKYTMLRYRFIQNSSSLGYITSPLQFNKIVLNPKTLSFRCYIYV